MTLQERLLQLKPHSIIVISGFGGSGKSTLAQEIQQYLPCTVIASDDFFTDQTTYSNWSCYEFDRLIEDIIIPFKEKRSKTYRCYNWQENGIPLYKKLDINDYLIIEGVGLLRDKILTHTDFSIWIDCPIDVAVASGKHRDQQIYGVSNEDLWNTIWKTNDLEYYQNHQPQRIADYVYIRL